MADEALTEQVIATIAGAARMAAVGGGDIVRLTSRPDDWLDAWDPALHPHDAAGAAGDVEALLPRRRCGASTTSRAEGPVLLVGNHSGGTLIADTFVFAQALLRPLRPVAALPPAGARPRVQGAGRAGEPVALGTVPASPENMARALERDAALLVYPGRRPRDLPAHVGVGEDRLRRADGLRAARDRARRPDRPDRRDRRPGDRAVPRPGPAASRRRCGSTACCG